jgi:SAM-dependent methyltransferase
MTDPWSSGEAYERFIGRWSRKVAAEFLGWLALPRGLGWADVGCGTAGLTSVILDACAPSLVRGVDSSEGFLAVARQRVTDARARFEKGDAAHLPWEPSTFDATVSGLVLNFVSDHERMVAEMARVTKPGGRVAVYVWDYGEGMQIIRYFWDVAIAVSPEDPTPREAEHFPVCRPDALHGLFERAHLRSVTVRAIDIVAAFRDFEDYWQPFLGRTGPAPSYLASVSDEIRERIRQQLQSRLQPAGRGPFELTARAWAVQGAV